MARKVILDVDPGIDDAVALCLALGDPSLDVLAVTATGGNVSPDQATTTCRRSSSSSIRRAGRDWGRRRPIRCCGPTGGTSLAPTDCAVPISPSPERHHRHPSVKVICDEVRAAPGEVTIVATGPLSNIAAALQQQPDLASLVGHLIILGGTLAGPGNVTAAAEFNIYCDAEAARAVFRSPITKTLIPIDVTSRIMLDLDLLEKIPDGDSRTRRAVAADCCPARFARIGSSSGWKAFTCTTRWRSSRRCGRSCSRRSGCTATWKPTARSPTGRRCSIAAASRRASRIWTWRSTWTPRRSPIAF